MKRRRQAEQIVAIGRPGAPAVAAHRHDERAAAELDVADFVGGQLVLGIVCRVAEDEVVFQGHEIVGVEDDVAVRVDDVGFRAELSEACFGAVRGCGCRVAEDVA